MDETTRELLRQMERMRAQLDELKMENRRLHDEASGIPTGWPQQSRPGHDHDDDHATNGHIPVTPAAPTAPVLPPPPAIPPAPRVPPASPVPPLAAEPTQPATERRFHCPVCHAPKREAAAPCPECGYAEKPRPTRLFVPRAEAPRREEPRPSAPSLLDRIRAAFAGTLAFLKEKGAERLVGEKLFNYAGMLLLVTGGAFFLKYTAGLAGPAGKLAIGLASSAALIGVGEALRRQPRFERFSVPIIGGGWILLYYAVFAAHYLPAAKVIASRSLEFVLLCATAAGMILHSLRARSRLLTAFAFGTAYFVFALTHLGVPTLTACAALAVAGALLVRPLKSPELAAISLAGFYLNYFPVFLGALGSSARVAFPAVDFWYSLGIATSVHAAFVLLAPEPEEGEGFPTDLCLSLSSVLYAVLFFSSVQSFAPQHATAALLGLAGVLGALSARRGTASDASALSAVQGFLAAAMTAFAVWRLDFWTSELWGFALAASVFASLGRLLGRRAFERYGVGMAALFSLTYLGHYGDVASARVTVGLAAGYLGLAGYALAWLGAAGGKKAEPLTGVWFYAGLKYVLLALWTWLEPAPFALAALALGLALEYAAATAESGELLGQALLVELGAGLYAFCIDYGPNAAWLGPLSPRLTVTAGLVAGYGSLLFGLPLAEGSFLGVSYQRWRAVSAWLMTGLACFGVYHEFGPRLRLPFWAASSLVLLALGRRRGLASVDLRAQAYFLMLGTAVEGVLSYYVYPDALLGSVGWKETAIFTLASVALLAPVFWPAWGQDAGERAEEEGAMHLSSLLSLGLLALFVAKEATGASVTLGWAGLGAAYVVAGLALRRQALRLPAVALLTLCLLKALFRDLSGLAVPERVLSYTVLGAVLVLSSYLYVRLSREAGEGPHAS